MGLSTLGSSSSRSAANRRAPCDPIPTVFTIRHVWEMPEDKSVRRGPAIRTRAECSIGQTWKDKDKLLAEVIYPNCPTFEGRKLILFAGVTGAWLKRQTAIDPHFQEGGHIIARFAPTADGLALALQCLKS